MDKPDKVKAIELQMNGTVEEWHTEVVDGREIVVVDHFTPHGISLVAVDPRQAHIADRRQKRPL